MTKTMLVDATHPEETRVAIVEGNRLSDFDFERANKKQLKGNIYLAKVIRVEPSLQAAFVEYGGNRHGFLPFSEIHPDYFRIPMADRPADETGSDDDQADGDDPSDQVTGEEISAYAEEREIVAQAAIQQEPAPMAENTVAVDPSLDSEPQPSGLMSEFAQDASQDLGLITDFGNAAVSAAPETEMAVIPVETIGGEPVEDAQRERRQHRPRYKIQEVVKRRQVMLIQVVKEERGNKGAALTTFLSLAGRYCVLMPNTDHGGGVSRKITSHQDRRRMKEMLDQLEVPEGMAVILRTAGMEQEPAEIQRDLEYLLRLWNNIREETLQSTAPALIYEEANLIKRSLRDLYSHELDSILVAGAQGFKLAHDFMRTIMPDSIDKVRAYEESVPLFFRYNVEKQIDLLYNPVVQLRSGGYIVINPTEALVSIDVNSGRATRERHIESTALKTNLEAAEEIARQLRLRDLAGLVVIDFIDMEDGRNNSAVERRVKDAMRFDRARLQIGRISPFGLLELSRQRIHSSLMEINFEKCPHCAGIGLVRSVDSAAISALRLIEEDAIKNGGGEISLQISTKVGLYVLNQKRSALSEIEKRYSLQVFLHCDDNLAAADTKLERVRSIGGSRDRGPAVNNDQVFAEVERALPPPSFTSSDSSDDEAQTYVPQERPQRSGGYDGAPREGARENTRGGRGRHGYGRGRNRGPQQDRTNPQVNPGQGFEGNAIPAPLADVNGNNAPNDEAPNDMIGNQAVAVAQQSGEGRYGDNDPQRRGRRRGRRGGRGRHGGGQGAGQPAFGQAAGAGEDNPQGGNAPRPPRDPNYQPRDKDGWNRNQVRSSENMPSAPLLPTNIMDIDTTPRDTSSYRPASPTPVMQQKPANGQGSSNYNAGAPSAPRTSSPPPYEVINESSSDKPKGGWWRRLTGQ